MSSREPMWYCHECRAEMRPLMVPDPHCASCNGTFVEKIETESDDPRAFQNAGPPLDDNDAYGPGIDSFLGNLTRLMNPGHPSRSPSSFSTSGSTSFGGPTGGGLRIEINRSGGGSGTRTFVLGGQPTLGGTRRTPADDGPPIAGPLMAQYLLSILASRGQMNENANPFGHAGLDFLSSPGGAENGRWGDYVFNQEALDQIISQIMENSNSSQPVPASEEVMNKLDRTVIEEGSPLLENDCAVCKEQFSLATEDPDEQVVVTLPCKHPFHEGCITPWLKSSGTCPVCRYQLVPQPEHHPGGAGPPGAAPGSPRAPGSSNQASPNGGAGGAGGGGGGILNALLNMVGGAAGSGGNGSGDNTTGASARQQQRQHEDSSSTDLPGGWHDEV